MVKRKVKKKLVKYHLPPTGSIEIPLYHESAELYDFLDRLGEIQRLKRIDHLGLIREVFEGTHHTRQVQGTPLTISSCSIY
jgi:hypothetical protein